MSIWTHVNGSVRIDDIRFGGIVSSEQIKKALGDVIHFDNIRIDTVTDLPMGTEGSLEYFVWVNPDVCCIPSYTVGIFGDLRDYNEEEAKYIFVWFENFLKKFIIRSAVLQVETEGSKPIVAVWDGENECLLYLIPDISGIVNGDK